MRWQSVPCKESIFSRQPPNLKQHSKVISDSQCVYEIDYAPYQNRWFIRRTVSREGRIERKLILVNVYNPQSKSTYEWCRPDLETIVREENLPTIIGEASPLENRLLKEDVLNYLQLSLNTAI